MKVYAIVTAVLAAGLATAAAHAQSPASPYTFTCGAYLDTRKNPRAFEGVMIH